MGRLTSQPTGEHNIKKKSYITAAVGGNMYNAVLTFAIEDMGTVAQAHTTINKQMQIVYTSEWSPSHPCPSLPPSFTTAPILSTKPERNYI